MKCEYCNKEFYLPDYIVNNRKKWHGIEPKYCSVICKNKGRNRRVLLCCKQCDKEVLKMEKEVKKSKTGNIFCSRSCSSKYNNTNKKTGTRRSKLEIWIEEKLKNKYNFDIVFNGKEAINSELDIYIPSLNLAFELNGIFHYEAIYGERKLEQIINNDNRKIQACIDKGIECCIIDTSNSKNFKPERDKKYLEIIKNIIENKLCRSGEIGSTR